MSEPQLLDWIERYLGHKLSEDEQLEFELMRLGDPRLNERIKEHQQFIKYLSGWNERVEFEHKLNAIHDEIDVDAVKQQMGFRQNRVIALWRNHHSKISVAASVAIFAVMLTLFFTGYFNNHKTQSTYVALRRDMESIKRSQNALIRGINNNNSSKQLISPGNFGGTGFALTATGDLITDLHVIIGADSIYVQDASGNSYKTKTVYTNPNCDLAILKIIDTTFKTLSPIPYAFKRSKADLGEDVFTIGYPEDNIVVGRGYLSSFSGYNNDSLAYRVSIPVNFGNSGGPLIDSNGNIIGIIKGKQTQVDGAAFATKSNYLMKAIQSIPADSTGKKIVLNSKNNMTKLSRAQQIKKLQNYVFMVKVYN